VRGRVVVRCDHTAHIVRLLVRRDIDELNEFTPRSAGTSEETQDIDSGKTRSRVLKLLSGRLLSGPTADVELHE
jgi:hypothetical protein